MGKSSGTEVPVEVQTYVVLHTLHLSLLVVCVPSAAPRTPALHPAKSTATTTSAQTSAGGTSAPPPSAPLSYSRGDGGDREEMLAGGRDRWWQGGDGRQEPLGCVPAHASGGTPPAPVTSSPTAFPSASKHCTRSTVDAFIWNTLK